MNLLIITIAVAFAFSLYYFLRRKTQAISRVGECSLCGKTFPDKNLSINKTLSLCPEDSLFYQSNTWTQAKRVISDPINPEASMSIYNLKQELLTKGIKSYILTDYHDNNGVIESIFTLYLRSDDILLLK